MQETPNVSLGPRHTLTHGNMQTHIHAHYTLMQGICSVSTAILQAYYKVTAVARPQEAGYGLLTSYWPLFYIKSRHI